MHLAVDYPLNIEECKGLIEFFVGMGFDVNATAGEENLTPLHYLSDINHSASTFLFMFSSNL